MYIFFNLLDIVLLIYMKMNFKYNDIVLNFGIFHIT